MRAEAYEAGVGVAPREGPVEAGVEICSVGENAFETRVIKKGVLAVPSFDHVGKNSWSCRAWARYLVPSTCSEGACERIADLYEAMKVKNKGYGCPLLCAESARRVWRFPTSLKWTKWGPTVVHK